MKQVSVHYLFSKNSKIGSKIISWGTKHLHPEVEDTPSHVAILVDERWVIESTLDSGVRVIPYKKWRGINKEVAKVPCRQPWTFPEIKKLFKPLKDKKYDYKGVTYFGLRLAANKAFKTEIPKKNKWETKNRYFCCEVMARMTGVDYQMTAPVGVMVNVQRAILEDL